MTIGVIDFVMGHPGRVLLGVLASVGVVASQTSIPLAVVLVVACRMAMTSLASPTPGGCPVVART